MRATTLAGTVAVLIAVGACSMPPKSQIPADGIATPQASQSPAGQASATGDTSASSGDSAGMPAGFEDFYTQHVSWTKCGTGMECATVRAPMSWQDASAGEINLNVKRLLASGDKTGSLLVNPGGPGGSGTALVDGARQTFGLPVLQHYDVVGFDPRGVQKSSAVTCLDDAAKDKALSEDFDDTDAGRAQMQAAIDAWAQACKQNTGELLAHVDTQSAARDMDMLRAIVGDEKLNYLGYSYGTDLGATYAGLFPDRVGRMVLDGALDPTMSPDEVSVQQAVGFENALRAYVKDCLGGKNCPLRGTVDEGMAQIGTMLERIKEHPLKGTDARPVTQTTAFTGIAVTLYNDDFWPVLTQALLEVVRLNTGKNLQFLADQYNDRNDNGTYSSNSSEAFRAVNCLDGRQDPDPAAMAAQAQELKKVAPTVGEYFSYGGMGCKNWPYPAVTVDYDVHAPGAAPVVVIGTTGDPATPYSWAQALSKTLDSAVLVTWEGEGHTAYGRSNNCIKDAVDAYLVDGTVPQDGLTC